MNMGIALDQLTIAELERQFAPQKAARTNAIVALADLPELQEMTTSIEGITGAQFFEPAEEQLTVA
jgi:hypothetical protein